jgi:hypothetical protein
VEAAVRRCLDWLRSDARSGDRGDRRLAAALALRALAESAPAVFNVHVRAFIDAVWAGLRDPRPAVRDASTRALRACLVLVEARETRYRVQWYYRLFEESRRGLEAAAAAAARASSSSPSPPVPPEVVLGSLAALGELLAHTGEFMLARVREVAAAALRFRGCDARGNPPPPPLRAAALALVPRLAQFAPERFAATYLGPCLEFALEALRAPLVPRATAAEQQQHQQQHSQQQGGVEGNAAGFDRERGGNAPLDGGDRWRNGASSAGGGIGGGSLDRGIERSSFDSSHAHAPAAGASFSASSLYSLGSGGGAAAGAGSASRSTPPTEIGALFGTERRAAFAAIGATALALSQAGCAQGMVSALPAVADAIADTLTGGAIVSAASLMPGGVGRGGSSS